MLNDYVPKKQKIGVKLGCPLGIVGNTLISAVL